MSHGAFSDAAAATDPLSWPDPHRLRERPKSRPQQEHSKVVAASGALRTADCHAVKPQIHERPASSAAKACRAQNAGKPLRGCSSSMTNCGAVSGASADGVDAVCCAARSGALSCFAPYTACVAGGRQSVVWVSSIEHLAHREYFVTHSDDLASFEIDVQTSSTLSFLTGS